MIPPIRVIMQNGTVHTFRRRTLEEAAQDCPDWARIERTDIKQPQPLIEGDDDA